jgi:hypothetical protein
MYLLLVYSLVVGGSLYIMRLRRRSPPQPPPKWLKRAAYVLALYVLVIGGWALIRCFEAVARVNPADKATILAAGISEAMNTMVSGTMLAWVPLFFFLVYFGYVDQAIRQGSQERKQAITEVFS